MTVSVPLPAVKDMPTSRWSMPKACVTVPLRTRTTEEMFAASSVWTVNCSPRRWSSARRDRRPRGRPPLGLNRYGG